MDCAGLDSVIVAFHRGDLAPQVGMAAEEHLLACSACLGGYLQLKRALDAAERNQRVPSPQIRRRLIHRAQAALLPLRRKPTAGGVLLLVAAAAALLFWVLQPRPRPAPTGEPALGQTQLIDTVGHFSQQFTTL